MSPLVAIVVPVYRHSALASEAIASALALGDRAVVVGVDDGCPNPETRAMLEGWSREAPPGRFHRLHQANRGLSGARNTGIRFALARYPGLQAIFPLDADNRLDAHALDLFEHLLATSRADWFYPNFDMFGLGTHLHNGGPFSRARMAESNTCDAGSLVRRRVFDAGVFFDETMRQGYEDWEFFLQAARAGFAGERVAQAFFRYRKRPESMLAGSHDADASLRAQIRARHRWLYDKDRVAREAAAETPRYLMIETVRPRALSLFTDPRQGTPISAEDAVQLLMAARVRPARTPAPDAVLIARPGVLDWLADRKLDRSVLQSLHAAATLGTLAAATLTQDPRGQRRIHRTPLVPIPIHDPVVDEEDWVRRNRVDTDVARARAAESAALDDADLILIARRDWLDLAFEGEPWEWIDPDHLRARLHARRVFRIEVELEAIPDPAGVAPEKALRQFTYRFHNDEATPDYLLEQGTWRGDPAVSGPAQMEHVLRRNTLGGIPLPLPEPTALRIGFVAPFFQFGGVEKCIVALARALSERGTDCHLFVYGTAPMTPAEWMTAPFAGIHQLDDPALRDWRGPQYMGTNLAAAPPSDLMADMLAPLASMDAVVVTGCAALFHGLGELRRKGIRVLAWEHLLETTAYGRAYGTPYLAVAYEGGLDLILTCSERLRDWMHGQGIPTDKLLALPNGPGFPVAPETIRADLATRAARPADAPLRVGFLGRFDSQKGADRFAEIATACAHLPIEFSITGGAILGDSAFRPPPGVALHPPAITLDELRAAFARLDILLMPSRNEGLPLTIFEAQRAGVIPIATDVGAVPEAIRDGETGFVVDQRLAVPAMTALLTRLSAEPALRQQIATRASGQGGRWAANAGRLLAALDTLGVTAAEPLHPAA